MDASGRSSSPDEPLADAVVSRHGKHGDPVLVEKFRRLLTGEEKGYAEFPWQELARVASEHYEPICTSCGDVATRWGCEGCS